MKEINLEFLRYHCLDRHHCAVQYYQLIDRIIKRFQGAYPDIEIESRVMRNWYQLMYILNKSLSTEETPDLFFTSGGGILEELASQGLVYDLSQELNDGWRETFIPAALEPLKHNNREFAIPLEQGFIFVWYNKSIFQESGLSIPLTFNELLDVCSELVRRSIVPFSMGMVEKWFGEFFFSYLLQRIGGEDIFVADFTKSLQYAEIRESFIEAAEMLLQLSGLGAFPENSAGLDYQLQRQLFIQGKTAMWLNGNRLLTYLMVEGPELLDHLGFFLFPIVENGKGKASTVFVICFRSMISIFQETDILKFKYNWPLLLPYPLGHYMLQKAGGIKSCLAGHIYLR